MSDITPEKIRSFEPGDPIAIEYESTQGDRTNTKTIEATVGKVDESETWEDGAYIFNVYLNIEEHQRERVHHSEEYHRRLHMSFVDGDSELVWKLEGRNGGRWNRLSSRLISISELEEVEM